MQADKLKKLGSELRKLAEVSDAKKREESAKIAVAAVGLNILQRKILSEVP